MDLASLLLDCCIILDDFFFFFCSNSSIKNMQISQKSPKVERKQKRRHQTSIENLQAAKCNQLQRTPSSKIGGGGARAARRIRIRRPRLIERGCKACRITIPVLQTPKPPAAPPSAADPPRTSPFPAPRTQNLRFLADFCRFSTDFLPIGNASKI